MRGRKPKPTFLKLIEGNPGHRPLNIDEPQPEGQLVDPPETFNAQQQALWRKEIAKVPEGMLRKLDMAAFASYIVHFHEFLHAAQRVAELGPIVRTRANQPQVNPYVGIRQRANLAMMKAATELGFTPSSRSRVKIHGKKKGKGSFGNLKTFEV